MHRGVGCLLAACFLLAGQQDTPEALEKRAAHAYQTKDYAAFLALQKQLLILRPEDPRALYNVACADALLGHTVEAIRSLDQMLAQHLDLGAEKDPDFNTIRKTPEWAQFTTRLTEMRKPFVRSSIAFTIPEKGLLASSVVIDERSGDAYIGSLRARKILKRSKDGVISDFATEKDGLFGVSYLLLDPIRNQLFASTSALPFMQGFRKEDEGKASICVFDLNTGKLLRTAALAIPAEHHILAQMTEDKNGNIFVVDTGSSEIRRLRRSSTELELFLSSVVFHAPRGIALSADERTIYVMDQGVMDQGGGIWAVDVLSIDRTHLGTAPGVWLGGITGLVRTPDGFVALQNGVLPNRMVRLHLDIKGESVAIVETLESNNPLFEAPMPGTLAGRDLLYIANSQLDLVDLKTGTLAQDRAKETVVLRLPLGN